jgi:hypothetical protein
MARSIDSPRRNFTPGEKLPHIYKSRYGWRWFGVANHVTDLGKFCYYMNYGFWPPER